jgi:TM2 domain-containing membrane protein YozV
MKRKRPELAIVASWVIPGLGQVYLGARRLGWTLVAVFLVFAIPIWAQLAPYEVAVWPALAVWAVAQVDVWRRAARVPRDYLEPREDR